MPPKLNKRDAKSHGSTASKLPKSRKNGTPERGIPNISWDNRLSALDESPLDNATRRLLEGCTETTATPLVNSSMLIQNSNNFPLGFPINTVRISELRKRVREQTLDHNANSVYPLIHEDMLPLIANWLKHKREHGSTVEKTLYKEMGLVEFVQRLLECRAFCFMSRKDKFKILEVKQGFGGWEEIGTDQEKPPLVLKNYLSYDEIKLSALLTMSSYTQFINDGSRKNKGVVTADFNELEERGVIIGVVGARFQRPGCMEYQDIAIAQDQNNVENGYGTISDVPLDAQTATLQGLRQVWARFYDNPHLPLYEEVSERLQSAPGDPKYIPVGKKYIFHAENYLKRTLITAEIILLEANARAKELNKTAYVHVVGFGLGVWKALPEQERYFLKAFEIAMKNSMQKLQNVSDVVFSYFRNEADCGGVTNGGQLGHINIFFEKREPHSRLVDDKLLVVTYAWDGNALPGNEFWMGKLATSGDPAAACSTQIAEIHNVRINPRASAVNLRIASPKHGIVHIADYAKLKL